jgi:hypothetical protein
LRPFSAGNPERIVRERHDIEPLAGGVQHSCAIAGATGASITSPAPCGGRWLASTIGTISGISSMRRS